MTTSDVRRRAYEVWVRDACGATGHALAHHPGPGGEPWHVCHCGLETLTGRAPEGACPACDEGEDTITTINAGGVP